MSGRRPLGPVDTLWLRADRPENLMVIDTVLWLDAPVDMERLRSVIRRRIVERYPVFSQRLAPDVLPLSPPQWEDDPEFDLDHHLRVRELEAPADESSLAAYVEQQMQVAFDPRRPLVEAEYGVTALRDLLANAGKSGLKYGRLKLHVLSRDECATE